MNEKLALIEKIKPKLLDLAKNCRFCMHECGVNRLKNERGTCKAGKKPAVYSYSPHHGEEPPLSGRRGSGTIFFTHCNLKCVYCQNFEFSQNSDFEEIEIEVLAGRMLELQKLGCHNINFVSPTHYAYQMVEALEIALRKSLDIPVVYNTGGYDNIELVKLLDGIVDIYLADMRYSEDLTAKKYSGAPDYVENNRLIIKEMFRQAGTLKTDNEGIAKKGVIVRLLILPENISGTLQTLEFLNTISNEIYLSVMSQYYPTYKARDYPELSRRINEKEYKAVMDEVERLGFANGWIQGFRAESERFLGTNIKPQR